MYLILRMGCIYRMSFSQELIRTKIHTDVMFVKYIRKNLRRDPSVTADNRDSGMFRESIRNGKITGRNSRVF
jgi:hypothetical protein